MAIFAKIDVFNACKTIAPKYELDPKLIYAVCLQEGSKNKKGDFEPDVARLEQGYYRRYVEPMILATTSEVLLAASYGIMQMMGLSLKEAGFFQWYFDHCSGGTRLAIKAPMSQYAVPSALDAYCTNLNWMIEWGCKWMVTKRDKAKWDIEKMLGYWNGDTSGKYASEVLERMGKL